jgi:alpha-beta hydrolase superfamily lysophospholipase
MGDGVVDVLGEPYQSRVIDLGHDEEGPVVATLVSRRSQVPTGRAVLYVHGFVDYFFQTHLADFYTDRGWDFYALDLRKYGRSLRPHQTPNFCRSLTDYYPELDAAASIIREEDGHGTLLVNGHSTGGLITSLWTHDRRDQGLVDGLILNSPFFDFNARWVMRRPVAAAVARVGRARPRRIVPLALSAVYGQTLHTEQRGEWTYDLAWKPLLGFPVRAGWLAAIREAQQRLRTGLAIPAPVLLACSVRSFRGSKWHETAALADAVLDVEHMVRWAPNLGSHVTVVRIDGGMHDLTLSGAAVRARVFDEMERWMDAYIERPSRIDEAGGAAEAA